MGRFIHEALWIGPIPPTKEEREKLEIAHEYVDGLVEQNESLQVAAEDAVRAWQYGRRSMREAMTNLASAVEGSFPASEPEGT